MRLRFCQYNTGHAARSWYRWPAIDDKESPRRTVYEVTSGIAEAFAAHRIAAAAPVAIVVVAAASAGAALVLAALVLAVAVLVVAESATVLAEAAGAKQKAAATPAIVGAAATVAPEGSLTRAGLEWRPKGVLSVKYAPTGTSEHEP